MTSESAHVKPFLTYRQHCSRHEEMTSAVLEMFEDTCCVVRGEVLRHLTRVNEIIRLGERVSGDVLVYESHVRVFGSIDAAVVGDNIRHYIHALVDDISPCSHEVSHPGQISTRYIQHPEDRPAWNVYKIILVSE